MKEVIIVASRGRDLPQKEGQWTQKLEINKAGYTNTITRVAKDNYVLICNK